MTLLTLVAVVMLLSPVILTVVGARRRGSGVVVSVLSGAFFLVARSAWYVLDMRRPA